MGAPQSCGQTIAQRSSLPQRRRINHPLHCRIRCAGEGCIGLTFLGFAGGALLGGSSGGALGLITGVLMSAGVATTIGSENPVGYIMFFVGVPLATSGGAVLGYYFSLDDSTEDATPATALVHHEEGSGWSLGVPAVGFTPTQDGNFTVGARLVGGTF